ncbi:MAG TPA: branched-chain-amino-acid transaminase [Myxococcota bacterium]|jgi:branched-chain amino acid aminotransferase|nr:branched-chain-amino-acid transaminase [Myxococcota bacterium]
MKVWLEGRVVDAADARIPVLDHGLLYGDGVFEGIRIYGRRVFRLDDHLARLAVSARAIGLAIPGGTEALRPIVLETARAFAAETGRDDGYVRLIVTRGDGALGVDPASCPTPRVVCIVDAIRLFPQEKLEQGLDLVTASVRRPPADVLEPRVKSLNYLNSVLAKQEARRQGADEALILNLAGQIAEASVANVFVVRGGALATPPATDGALEGITRATVLELAASLGIPAGERTLGRVDLFGADEAFLTGTGARIVPVRSLDGCVIGKGGLGPVTAQIVEAFLRYAHEPAHGVAF